MGMKLPGSRPDVRRTKSLSGPSPVGGSFGGTDSQKILSLDDFELQAAHYNMACAYSRLGNLEDVSSCVSRHFSVMIRYKIARYFLLVKFKCCFFLVLTFAFHLYF
jgi:hypothetical protein